jgi:hypothetical protein
MSPHSCAYRGHALPDTRGRDKRDTPMGCCPACPAAPLRKAGHCGTLSRLSRVSRTANLHCARVSTCWTTASPERAKPYDPNPHQKQRWGASSKGAANERYALVAAPAGAAYRNYNSNKRRPA